MRFLLCAWVPNRTFSATLAFPGRYLLAAPHELFPTTVTFFCCCLFPAMAAVECCQFIKLMQSFKSKEYVKESFAWRHYYWSVFYFILYFFWPFSLPLLRFSATYPLSHLIWLLQIDSNGGKMVPEATRLRSLPDPFHKEKENVRSATLHCSNVIQKLHCSEEFTTHFVLLCLLLRMQVKIFQGKLFTDLSYSPLRTWTTQRLCLFYLQGLWGWCFFENP